MNKARGFILAVAAAAMAFTVSCVSDIETAEEFLAKQSSSSEGNSSPSGNGNSSPSAGVSSSSKGGNSCPTASGNVFIDPRDCKAYGFETAPDGTVWMSENLNYSRSNTLGYCYGVDIDGANPHQNASTCDNGYGRVYEWATAIDGNQPQGLCPDGWHIPSVAEWNSVISTTSTNRIMSPGFYIYPGVHNTNIEYPPLGWKERDKSGFYWTSSGNTYFTGFWEGSYCQGTTNHCYLEPKIDADLEPKTDAQAASFSVRCIADYGSIVIDRSSSSVAGSSSSSSSSSAPSGTAFCKLPDGTCSLSQVSAENCSAFGGTLDPTCAPGSSSSSAQPSSSSVYNILYGTPVTYGGETYQTVVIGTQTWFAKNLNYNEGGSVCYNNEQSNCATYGRLYNWATAMNLPSSCNGNSCSSQIGSPHRGICPSGWHIPSYDDWNTLENFVESNSGCSSCDARLLKAKSGWSNNGNGTDAYGFSALPGGNGGSDGSFYGAGDGGFWWSVSENYSDGAYFLGMYDNGEGAYWYGGSKSLLFSVRCLQD